MTLVGRRELKEWHTIVRYRWRFSSRESLTLFALKFPNITTSSYRQLKWMLLFCGTFNASAVLLHRNDNSSDLVLAVKDNFLPNLSCSLDQRLTDGRKELKRILFYSSELHRFVRLRERERNDLLAIFELSDRVIWRKLVYQSLNQADRCLPEARQKIARRSLADFGSAIFVAYVIKLAKSIKPF